MTIPGARRAGALRHEGEERAITAGDVIAAPVGEAHQIVNTSDCDLRYLVFSSQEQVDVVRYPDSGKVLAYAEIFGEQGRHISREEDARDYFDREEPDGGDA